MDILIAGQPPALPAVTKAAILTPFAAIVTVKELASMDPATDRSSRGHPVFINLISGFLTLFIYKLYNKASHGRARAHSPRARLT